MLHCNVECNENVISNYFITDTIKAHHELELEFATMDFRFILMSINVTVLTEIQLLKHGTQYKSGSG